MKNISRSLRDLLGSDYIDAVISVATEICGMDKAEAESLANEKVDFFPEEYIEKMDALAEKTGEKALVPAVKIWANLQKKTSKIC